MRGVEDFAQIVFSFLIRKADAKKNLNNYLEVYLRPDILNKVEIGNLLISIANKLGEGADKKLFLEDLVDRFMEDKKGEDIRALVTSKAKRKLNIDRDTASKIVGSKKGLTSEEERYLKEIIKEFVPLISKYLYNYFNSEYKAWVREHEKEPRITEDMPEPSVPPEHEMEEEIKRKHEWEEGLIKDVINLIDREVPKDLKSIYKLILKDMFLAAKPKGIAELARQVGLSTGVIHKYKTALGRMLATFLTAQGLGGKFLEEGGMARKEVSVPKYTVHLKEKKHSDDFKSYAEDKFGPRTTDVAKKIIMLFAEGKDVSSVVSESGESQSNVKVIKHRYFDPWYKEWYEEKVDEVRKTAHFYIKKAFMELQGKKVVIPYEKKETDDTERGEAVAAAHENMVNRAIDKHEVVATIFFTANYDNLEVLGGRKDPEKDPVDFKYKGYEATFYKERKFGKVARTIDYRYTQKLSDKGDFEGSGKSTLSLDGKKVSENNELKKDLDNYVERHMKPEGILPYGRAISKKTKNVLFPVGYENTKTNKKYNGVRQFFEKYRGLLVEDIAHGERKKFVEERELRKQLPVGERERIKEKLFDMKEELEELKDQKPRDNKRIKELEGHIKDLSDFIKGKGDETVKEIEDIIEMEMRLLHPKSEEKTAEVLIYAAAFPEPISADVKKLVDVLSKYNVTKPKTVGWLEPVDILTLAKGLKAHAKVELERQLKDLKSQKGVKDKAQQAVELETAVRNDVSDAIDLFKALPSDLKKRRDLYKDKFTKDYESLASRRNLTWVDNESEINRIMEKIMKEFRESVLEMKKKKAPKKPQMMRVLEKAKFKSLEAFLEQALDGLDTIGKRFNKVSLEKVSMNPEAAASVSRALAEAESDLSKLKKELEELTAANGNGDDRIKELKSQMPAYLKKIREMKETLKKGEEIPALTMAKVLLDKISYFSGLYSLLSGILWFGESAHIQSEDKEKDSGGLSEEERSDLTKLRKNIVDGISVLSKYNIQAKDQIKSGLAKVRTLVKRFIKEYDYIKLSYDEIPSVRSFFPYMIAADDSDDARVKMIFPADELESAQRTVESLKKNKDTAAKADMAQKELNSIKKNVSQAYGQGFSNEKIKALAKKEDIPFDKASTRLKRIQDSLARAALSEFIIKWKEAMEPFGHAEKKKRAPSEYDEMGNFVERQLPSLFELTPPEKVPEEPKRGVPTPKVIRERIENEFSKGKPEGMTEKYDFFTDSSGTGGGGGAKSKGRKKAVKPPPPKATVETLKDDFVKMFKKYSGDRLVLTVMAQYVKRLRGVISNLKEGEYLDVDDVIEGFIGLLKGLQFLITTLKIEPSATAWRLPPVGMPKFTGKPDIEINSSKEAKEVFNKIMDIYKTINKYIAPDQVGIPPSDISQIRKQKKYLPTGLVDWYQHLEESEKRKKEAQNYPMGFRIAHKFAMTNIQTVNNFVEEDLILR